ncbi:hypothetical protein JAAARDRAFT_544555 [Jaapia argillacea MUCL 33604]|uniref:RING-type domain-containing protein n=1 Tax=Jaapia argillacea MUCL 33604 TaxID=933084 RepID=A0A067PAI8_9AGAM|nr:hypothetical protein JAAARDRAFT_544555 [Jaapia argillacea MUCL 33604]
MSISPSEVFSGIKFIQGVVSKVKDNRTNLQRLSSRLEHILVTIEETKSRDAISSDDYNDAMTVLSELVERSQRATQKELKRSLGDRTWNRNEIDIEIKRIIEDVNHHLSTHSIQVMDAMQITNEKSFTMLSNMVSSGMEDIMAMVAALDQRLNTPAGPNWSPLILARAQDTWRQLAREVEEQSREQSFKKATAKSERGFGPSPNVRINSFGPAPPQPVYNPDRNSRRISVPTNGNLDFDIKSVRMMAAQGRTSIQITGLRHSDVTGDIMERVTIENIHPYAHFNDVLKAIRNNGYNVPDDLIEDQLLCNITKGSTQFDATAPGGLQIDETMPLIQWWTKYIEFHGLAPATTPSHTLATLSDYGTAVTVGGVEFRFHRTLRVPDGAAPNMLPESLGMFPLVPVAKYAHKLPPKVVEAGGFIIPMFQREAMWIAFTTSSREAPEAIKVSVGSVNAISGIPKDKPTPPSGEQDYIVAGLQPWLDGVMTEAGVVRQFVAMSHGGNYTVEEQVTGEAKHGGMQFDVFPRRDERFGEFYLHTRGKSHWTPDGTLASDKTPRELNLRVGSVIGVRDVPSMKGDQDLVKNWRLSGYRRRVHNVVHLNALYHRVPTPPIYVQPRTYVQPNIYVPPNTYVPPPMPPIPNSYPTHDEGPGILASLCCCFGRSRGNTDMPDTYYGGPKMAGPGPFSPNPYPEPSYGMYPQYPVAPIATMPTYYQSSPMPTYTSPPMQSPQYQGSLPPGSGAEPTYTSSPGPSYPPTQSSMPPPPMMQAPSQFYSTPEVSLSTPYPAPMESCGPPSYDPPVLYNAAPAPNRNNSSYPEPQASRSEAAPPPPTAVSPLGLAPGGKIEQKIYQDSVSPRMYDEEQGHRFHIHILSPSDWEIVTGVLPPISPITAESYTGNNIPWFSIADDYTTGLTNTSQALGNLKSVHEMDRSKGFQLPDLVDPDRPPNCPLHSRSTSTCIFRPCSHVGCDSCLGAAMLKGSRCPKCNARVERFVGIKEPIAQVTEMSNDAPGSKEWNVAQIEDLAQRATVSNNVAIIHLEGDRVAPLHAPPSYESTFPPNRY